MAQLTDDCFAFGGRLLPLDDAMLLLMRQFGTITDSEEMSLANADGCILAEDLISQINIPPHSNSAVDGYAVHFDDLAPNRETILKVHGRATAGYPILGPAPRGYATRIFTGAVMPDGPDTVLMQEDCLAVEEEVRIRPGIQRGANRRLAGEDVSIDSIALTAGRRLGPPEIGLAAALGVPRLTVRRPLRIAIFSTGDELSEPGIPLAPGQIYDSNRPMLIALLRRAGTTVIDGGVLPDEAGTLRDALQDAAGAADLIITSGGVSVGEEDHVRLAIEKLGAVSFWRLGIKPGRPVAVGLIGATPMVGLPGNPVAAMVTYLAIVRPLVAILRGEAYRPPTRFPVVSRFSYRKKTGRREYVRVNLTQRGDGLEAERFHKEGSGLLSSLTRSDGLVELGEDTTDVQPGQIVHCIPFGLLYY